MLSKKLTLDRYDIFYILKINKSIKKSKKKGEHEFMLTLVFISLCIRREVY